MGLLSSLFGKKEPQKEQQSKQEKKNFEILKYDGIRARNMRQLPYAIKCFEQALTIEDDIETMQQLATAYMESDRIDDARLMLDKLAEKDPSNINTFLTLANLCYLQEDYESMENVCQKALKLDDKSAGAYYLAGKASHAMRNDIQAIVMLTKAIQNQEDYTSAYLLRAEVLWGMHQFKEAMDDINVILAQNAVAEEEDALILKGKILAATSRIEEAYECFDQILEINPFNEKAYILKGEMFIEQKKFDQATELYTEAIELMPQNAHFYQERGRARLLEGDKNGSVEDMKKAIELNPDSEKSIDGNYDNFNTPAAGSIY